MALEPLERGESATSSLTEGSALARESSIGTKSVIWSARTIESRASEATVEGEGEALRFASQRLRNDRAVVSAAAHETPEALRHAFWAARGDGHFMRGLLRFRGILLEFASDALRADRDTVLIAVTQDGAALQHASRELRKDRDFVLVALAAAL